MKIVDDKKMKNNIPYLKKGDKIVLLTPAKSIDLSLILDAKEFWSKNGFKVHLSEFSMGQKNYFSGTINERLNDFQAAIDDVEIKAIVCNRGGYGCIQFLDKINWSNFIKKPKWIIGFSDVTVFHQHLQKLNYCSIHATMPLNYKSNTKEALNSLLLSVKGKMPNYQIKSNQFNICGTAIGKLIGGNLSIIYSLIGTNSQPEYENCILFIEDLSEQLYHIDRMFYSLSKSNILPKIKGLIVGGMTDLKDTEIPYGKTIKEIIIEHLFSYNIPVIFDFPAGHIDDNRALVFGKTIKIEVDPICSNFEYIE